RREPLSAARSPTPRRATASSSCSRPASRPPRPSTPPGATARRSPRSRDCVRRPKRSAMPGCGCAPRSAWRGPSSPPATPGEPARSRRPASTSRLAPAAGRALIACTCSSRALSRARDTATRRAPRESAPPPKWLGSAATSNPRSERPSRNSRRRANLERPHAREMRRPGRRPGRTIRSSPRSDGPDHRPRARDLARKRAALRPPDRRRAPLSRSREGGLEGAGGRAPPARPRAPRRARPDPDRAHQPARTRAPEARVERRRQGRGRGRARRAPRRLGRAGARRAQREPRAVAPAAPDAARRPRPAGGARLARSDPRATHRAARRADPRRPRRARRSGPRDAGLPPGPGVADQRRAPLRSRPRAGGRLALAGRPGSPGLGRRARIRRRGGPRGPRGRLGPARHARPGGAVRRAVRAGRGAGRRHPGGRRRAAPRGLVMARVRVLVADDHTIVRQGLVNLLEESGECEVVAEAADGLEAVEKALATRPEVAILDLSMPRLSGLDAVRRIHEALPSTRLLVLTVHEEEEYVLPLVRAGAAGYLIKDSAVAELLAAVRALHAGHGYFSPQVARVLAEQYRHPERAADDPYGGLSPREREVFHLVVEGKTTKEIARALAISVKTADNHRYRLMEKLDVHNAAELVRYAARHGLLP